MRDEAEITRANRSARTSGQRGREWARADEMEAQRGARPNLGLQLLEKTRRPQARNRIDHRLPTEYPAGHRKTHSRVTQMHEPHRHPQSNRPQPQGRISITMGKIAVRRRLHKAQRCHLRSTEVIGHGPQVRAMEAEAEPTLQCASLFSSPAVRPAGGTTTVERLPSAVSFWKAARSRHCRSSQRLSNSPLCRFNFSN